MLITLTMMEDANGFVIDCSAIGKRAKQTKLLSVIINARPVSGSNGVHESGPRARPARSQHHSGLGDVNEITRTLSD
jgi:hypothetical protein